MQQTALFETNIISLRRGNLEFISQVLVDNTYIATLSVPSGKFIVKYNFEDEKICEFEILDYTGYLYVTKAIIKNIKNLVQTIVKS